MVRTLVITVDRDNDLGIKAAIRGPVIGRKAVLTAALRLGIADPEESDTNAILGALHHHDRISESTDGEEVEAAVDLHRRVCHVLLPDCLHVVLRF